MDRLLNTADKDNDEEKRAPTSPRVEDTHPLPHESVTGTKRARSLSPEQVMPTTTSSTARPQKLLQPFPGIPSQVPATSVSTPRLPPISMLTAAASTLQARQRGPATPPHPEQTVNDPDMLCRYRNKKCGYPRAIKRNGDRHNLCERHRAKANQNQRKLESKRRTQKRMNSKIAQQQQHPSISSTSATNTSNSTLGTLGSGARTGNGDGTLVAPPARPY